MVIVTLGFINMLFGGFLGMLKVYLPIAAWVKWDVKIAIVPMVILSLLIIFIDLRPNIILNVLKGDGKLFKVHGDIHPHF